MNCFRNFSRSSGVQIEDLSHQILEVDDLDALVAKNLGKRVVLFLSNLEERNVVEEQFFERVGVRFKSSLPGRWSRTFFRGMISLLTFTPAMRFLLFLEWIAT